MKPTISKLSLLLFIIIGLSMNASAADLKATDLQQNYTAMSLDFLANEDQFNRKLKLAGDMLKKAYLSHENAPALLWHAAHFNLAFMEDKATSNGDMYVLSEESIKRAVDEHDLDFLNRLHSYLMTVRFFTDTDQLAWSLRARGFPKPELYLRTFVKKTVGADIDLLHKQSSKIWQYVNDRYNQQF